MALSDWKKTGTTIVELSEGETVVEEYRFTFRTASNLDVARYNRERLRFLDGAKEDEAAKEEIDLLFNIVSQAALVLSTLDKVEQRDGKKWIESSLPDDWIDAVQFAKNSPPGLINELVMGAAAAGNSLRLFGLNSTDELEKKMMRLSVRQSED